MHGASRAGAALSDTATNEPKARIYAHPRYRWVTPPPAGRAGGWLPTDSTARHNNRVSHLYLQGGRVWRRAGCCTREFVLAPANLLLHPRGAGLLLHPRIRKMADVHIAKRAAGAKMLAVIVLAFVCFLLAYISSKLLHQHVQVKPFHECETQIFTRRRRSSASMAQHLSVDVLNMSSSQRVGLITRAEDWWSKHHRVATHGKSEFQLKAGSAKDPAKRLRIVLCLAGVIPRGRPSNDGS